MSKFLDIVLLKNVDIVESDLSSSLYLSYDNISALRKEYMDVLNVLKIYNSYEIIDTNNKELSEGYDEEKYIVNVGNKLLFIRIVTTFNTLYDLLVYTIDDIEKIKRIFFSDKQFVMTDEILKKLEGTKARVLLDLSKDGYFFINANEAFYNLIKFEDWDYKNKHQNQLKQRMDDIDLIRNNKVILYRIDDTKVELEYDIEYIDEKIAVLKEK